MTGWRKHLDRSMVVYGLMSVLVALLGLTKQFLFARLLMPDEFGLYTLVLTIYVYIHYAGSLGLNEALIKLGSMSGRRGNDFFRHRLRDVSIVAASISLTIVGGLFLVGLYFFYSGSETKILSLIVILALTAMWFNLSDSYLRCSGAIIRFSIVVVVRNFLVLAIGLFVYESSGVLGIVLAEVISFGAAFSLAMVFSGKKINFHHARRDIRLLKMAISNGFPMLLSMFVRKSAMSLDRFVIAACIGLTAVGKYGFCMILFLVSTTLMGFVNNVVGPKWLKKFSQVNSICPVYGEINTFVRWLLLFGFVGFVPFYFLLPHALSNFYPSYNDREVVLSTYLIYFGVIILFATQLYDWIFIATSNEKYLFKISIYVLIVTVFAMIIAVYFSLSIVGYAAAFLCVRIIVSVFYVNMLRGRALGVNSGKYAS